MKDAAIDQPLVLGTDRVLPFDLTNYQETQAVDATAYTWSFMIKRSLADLDVNALLTKTTGSGIAITGVFNPTITTNTQRIEVTILDTDTDNMTPGVAYYELKSMTPGSERVGRKGPILLERGVHRS